jgi:hypothetical protein
MRCRLESCAGYFRDGELGFVVRVVTTAKKKKGKAIPVTGHEGL